jgi:hypothetical protein
MSFLNQLGASGWSSIVKRIGQSAVVIFNVFFGPMPLPTQLTVWPRMIIALAVVASFPLLAIRNPERRRWVNVLAGLCLVSGLAFGLGYWLALPSRTLLVRGELYVTGEVTSATQQELAKNQLRDSDISKLIEGQANNTVESFFESESVGRNMKHLALLYILFLVLVTIPVMIFLEWIQ